MILFFQGVRPWISSCKEMPMKNPLRKINLGMWFFCHSLLLMVPGTKSAVSTMFINKPCKIRHINGWGLFRGDPFYLMAYNLLRKSGVR